MPDQCTQRRRKCIAQGWRPHPDHLKADAVVTISVSELQPVAKSDIAEVNMDELRIFGPCLAQHQVRVHHVRRNRVLSAIGTLLGGYMHL